MRFRTRRVLSAVVGFCIGTTVGFPLEHLLYERIWPFTALASWLGIH